MNNTAAISDTETLQMKIIDRIYNFVYFPQILYICCLVMHIVPFLQKVEFNSNLFN